MNSSSNQQNYPIVVIVAMGGVGKTTLAQIVYSDDAVTRHFEYKLWVCVSQSANQKEVFNRLLESINQKKDDFSSLDVLVNSLKKNLQNKRYLIVLDDMWNDKHNEWDNMLKTLLLIGAQGSKVIVTTRSNEVASMTSSLYRYKLGNLSDKECWTLF
ncbi:putative disease resistance protein RGA3 [Papaver somniferum]|uniref:putative disease resistance protein RGA3 n=1 Tax=Papaver somniferum TaxID=3469 RepID=UPI000E6F9BC2|nr:putative disease resistance protein RGA3 [Papaver somniferum]